MKKPFVCIIVLLLTLCCVLCACDIDLGYKPFRALVEKGNDMLTLSFDQSFADASSKLTGGSKDAILLDTTYTALPSMRFAVSDGYYDGVNDYTGASFYLRSTETTYFSMKINASATGSIDCLRVLVIARFYEAGNEEPHYFCYGKAQSGEDTAGERKARVAYPVDRNGEIVGDVYDPNSPTTKDIWYCADFTDAEKGEIATLYCHMEEQQLVRLTVVAWYEGTDPDITDQTLGGSVGISLSFAVEEESN